MAVNLQCRCICRVGSSLQLLVNKLDSESVVEFLHRRSKEHGGTTSAYVNEVDLYGDCRSDV